jgi:hypothetical protein
MRVGSERVGPVGGMLLGAAGLVGLLLAIHGYGHGGLAAGTLAAPAKSAQTRSSSARASAGSGSTTTTQAASSTSSPPAQKVGPLLSSTQYAPYAYQLYPGQETSQAKLATAGFGVKITPDPGGSFTLSVSAAGSGQGPQTHTYAAGDRVYFIEASFGDDSANSEYNFGDDGVVVTDASGHIVQ